MSLRDKFPAVLAALLLGGLGVFVGSSSGCQQRPDSLSLEEINPGATPYTSGSLVIAGTQMPVEIIAERKPSEVVFLLRSKHGETLEHEAYKFDRERFSLWRAGGELYDPVIPLLSDPVRMGSKWQWAGSMSPALSGVPSEDEGSKTSASADVSVDMDQLNMRTGPVDAVRVEVLLKMASGGSTPAQRKLIFWFAPGKGMVKREFAAASTRLPSGEESE